MSPVFYFTVVYPTIVPLQDGPFRMSSLPMFLARRLPLTMVAPCVRVAPTRYDDVNFSAVSSWRCRWGLRSGRCSPAQFFMREGTFAAAAAFCATTDGPLAPR